MKDKNRSSTTVERMTADEREAFIRSTAETRNQSHQDLTQFTSYLLGWFIPFDSPRHRDVSARAVDHLLLELASGITTVPRIIEEYNKSKMPSPAYTEVGERVKHGWNADSTLKGRVGGRGMGRTSAEAIAIPLSAPIIVISEQEIEMPAVQERSIRVQLTKLKRKDSREDFRLASKGRQQLRRLGKAIMASALTTSPEAIEALMDKAGDLLPPDMDDRPRFSLQVILVGLWKLREVCEQLHLFKGLSVLDPVLNVMLADCADAGDGYMQSEIDLVLQKIEVIVAVSRSADEAKMGTIHLHDGLHYVVTAEYLILDPVLAHASYTRYCNVDERSAPVIGSATQFVKLIQEEPYFEKYAPYASMGGGGRCSSCR
ncbi:MAG: hypothetical protein Q8R69_00150 [Telluria sp.]|nr:hypothetical protein [Telluria sp.]